MSSKRFKKLPTNTALLQSSEFEKLIKEVKTNCTTKFDESIDLNLQINNKQKKGEVNLRTVANLPAGSGKEIKVAVVCEDNKTKEAKDAGADLVGGEEFIEKMKGGELNFDKLICSTSMMIKLSKLGKVLGPKGLMPNPKLGSVTDDLKKAVTDAKSGQVEIKNDKDGNIGLSLGKKNFSDEKLIKNFDAIFEILEREKGNITIKENSPFIHIHATISDEECNAFAGHLFTATTAVTCEIILNISDKPIIRKECNEVGLYLWDFNCG